MCVCVCGRSVCGCVSGLVVLITTHFGRISTRRDGNFEEMALKQIAPTLLALLGLVAVGSGEFHQRTSPAFVSMCFSWTGHRLLSLIVMALCIWDLASRVLLALTSKPRLPYIQQPKARRCLLAHCDLLLLIVVVVLPK